jgi:hypothetical protein
LLIFDGAPAQEVPVTDYVFSKVLVYDSLGGAVRLARGATAYVLDPTTGLTAPGLKVAGIPVTVVVAGHDGAATFTTTIAEVDIVSPKTGFSQRVVATQAVLDHATDVATTVATDVASQVAADVAHGDSHVLLDTDGTPYYDLTAPGTQVMSVDSDGVPYFL